jgi:hypothetical protein
MMAKASLSAMEPLLRSRVLKAALNQFGQIQLHFPTEDEPGLRERIRAAKTKRKPL